MSDFYATEKIIGGAVLIGAASLMTWSVSQSGDAGVPGILFGIIGVFGAVWVVLGLFELVVGHRWHRQSEAMELVSGEPEATTH